MRDASNPKEIRKAEKDAKLAELQRLEVYTQIMAYTAGRRWMHDLLADCGIGSTPFTLDPHVTSFNCGQQNIGLRLLSDIMAACPDEYVLMMREANERNRTDDRGPVGDHANGGRVDSTDAGADGDEDGADAGTAEAG